MPLRLKLWLGPVNSIAVAAPAQVAVPACIRHAVVHATAADERVVAVVAAQACQLVLIAMLVVGFVLAHVGEKREAAPCAMAPPAYVWRLGRAPTAAQECVVLQIVAA